MISRISSSLIKRFGWLAIGFCLLALPAHAQSNSEVNLKGAIDTHTHEAPDSMTRAIDADDDARLAEKMGMRGLVYKNHYEDTAALAYMMRKEVPGIELFGGITMDLSNGGICLESVEHMATMKGGWGRVIWLPTNDSEHTAGPGDSSAYSGAANHSCGGATKEAGKAPFVRVSENGHLVPSVLELIDYIAKHPQLVLETGHSSNEEVVMIVHEAHTRGVAHIIVTHVALGEKGLTVPQLLAVAKDGGFMEITALAMLGPNHDSAIKNDVAAIRAVGAKSFITCTDLGRIDDPAHPYPLEPQGLLDFMVDLHKAGISVPDINLMAKTNPALALGLQP